MMEALQYLCWNPDVTVRRYEGGWPMPTSAVVADRPATARGLTAADEDILTKRGDSPADYGAGRSRVAGRTDWAIEVR